jgi:predicted CoA-binding protein
MSKPTVAILGASSDRSKFGNKSLRAHRRAGYEVYPVNPKGGRIEGLEVHATLAELPVKSLDRISIYLPPAVGLTMLAEIAAIDCGEVWFNPGSESRELLDEARALGIRAVAGCSIVELGMSPSDFP